MAETLLEAVTIEPKKAANACIIWLHGLGADGHDFKDVIPNLGLPANHGIRFIFPHAPTLPVTINAGMVMPAWYDVAAIDLEAVQDEAGIKKSESAVIELILENIRQGISSERIILIGFSQGGALALYTALRFPQPLGGVASLSAYLPLHDKLMHERHAANEHLDIFMGHGFMDPIVSYWIGQKSMAYLQGAGFDPKWHAYPMVHTVCLTELNDIGKWIREVLS